MNPVSAYIPRAAIRAMSHLMAKSDVRYYLNGILVEVWPGEVRLVATNGHFMGALRIAGAAVRTVDGDGIDCDYAGDPLEIIIPDVTIRAIKSDRHVDMIALHRDSDGRYSLRDLNATHAFTPIDGKFPDYRRVMPKNVNGECAQYNPDYIGAFAKVAAELGGKRAFNGLCIVPNGMAVACVSIDGRTDFAGALMPLRMDNQARTSPDWATARYVAPAEELAEPVEVAEVAVEVAEEIVEELDPYEARVRELEADGCTRSDAQAIADAEEIYAAPAVDAVPYWVTATSQAAAVQ